MVLFLPDEYILLIEEAIKLNEKYINEYDELNKFDFDMLETNLISINKKLESACYNRIRKEFDTCYNDKYLFQYFIDMCFEMDKFDWFYINDKYELFKHVEYEKSFV